MLTDPTPFKDSERAAAFGVGLVSPLWATFAVAAAGGLAYWSLSRWVMGETPAFAPPAASPAPASPAREAIEETVSQEAASVETEALEMATAPAELAPVDPVLPSAEISAADGPVTAPPDVAADQQAEPPVEQPAPRAVRTRARRLQAEPASGAGGRRKPKGG